MIGLCVFHAVKQDVKIESNKVMSDNDIRIRVENVCQKQIQQSPLRRLLHHLDLASLYYTIKAGREWTGGEWSDIYIL